MDSGSRTHNAMSTYSGEGYSEENSGIHAVTEGHADRHTSPPSGVQISSLLEDPLQSYCTALL